MSEPAVDIKEVSRKFRRGGKDFWALRDITLCIEPGQVFVITGRSGSGKTTLLNILGGLESATQGSVNVCGFDLASLGKSGLADFRRNKVGFVFQACHLIEEKSAVSNVMLPLMIAGVSPKEAKKRAIKHLESVGLADISMEKVKTFSAGQKQRTALARGLVNDPELLIADEPTGNLDQENGSAVFSLLIKNASEKGKTILIATHDLAVLPGSIENIISLEHGILVNDQKTA